MTRLKSWHLPPWLLFAVLFSGISVWAGIAQAAAPWPSRILVHDEGGNLLYEQQWVSAKSDGALSQWRVLYKNAQNSQWARRDVEYSAARPYQPHIELQISGTEQHHLYREERWVHKKQWDQESREKTSWPRIRNHVVVDLALVRYVVENREKLLDGSIKTISHFSLLQHRSQTLDVQATQRFSPRGMLLELNLMEKKWLSDAAAYARFRIQLDTGKIDQAWFASDVFMPTASDGATLWRMMY